MAFPEEAADEHVSLQSTGNLHAVAQQTRPFVGQKSYPSVRERRAHSGNRFARYPVRTGHGMRYVLLYIIVVSHFNRLSVEVKIIIFAPEINNYNSEYGYPLFKY